MAQTFNLSFLIENAPSDEYRSELLKLAKMVNTDKTEYMKTKFKTLSSFIAFIEYQYLKYNPHAGINDGCKCKIFGSFVRQYFEMIYATPSDQAYGNVLDHDVDIRLFGKVTNDIDKKFIGKLIEIFQLIMVSKHEQFDFNGYKLMYYEDKTITQINEHDADGKKLLHNIPHYFIVLEKGDDQIHIDLLSHNPKTPGKSQDFHKLWNRDYNVNGMFMSRDGISINKGENFFEIQNSIMNRDGIMRYPIKNYVSELRASGLSRSKKTKLYNQIIHFIAFRTKIEEGGYKRVSDCEMLNLSVEEEETCPITDFDAPYINVGFECSHNLSIMAFAKIVNIRASDDTEAIVCPYCRKNLIPKMIESPPFEKIVFPSIPNFSKVNKGRVKKLCSSHDGRMLMSEENLSCVSGIFQGFNISEVRAMHQNSETFSAQYELLLGYGNSGQTHMLAAAGTASATATATGTAAAAATGTPIAYAYEYAYEYEEEEAIDDESED